MEAKKIFLDKKIFNKNKNNEDKRIYYFDYLRILCAFFVTSIHVCSEYFYSLDVKSYKWKIAYFYNGLSRFSVPIFFMISGALFLNRDLSFGIIVNKYIKNLFIHLLLWSIIYSLMNLNLSKFDIKQKLLQIIRGHYHLWYLFATIGIYIIVPFFREIVKNKQLFKSFIFLYFIFLFIIPNYIYLLSYYSKETSKLLYYLSSHMNLNNLSVNNFYFIFGHYLNNKKEIKKQSRIIIYIIIHFHPKYLNIFFYSTSIFLFFKNNFNNLKINERKNNIIQRIAKY